MLMKKVLEKMKKKDPKIIILEKRNELGIATGEVMGIKFVPISGGGTDIQIIGGDNLTKKDVMEVVDMLKDFFGQDKVVSEGWCSNYQHYLK